MQLQHPSRGIVAAASGRGKTRWMVDRVLDPQSPWKQVHVFCDELSADQSEYQRLQDQFKGPVTMHTGLPKNEDDESALLAQLSDSRIPKVCIVDDLMEQSERGRPQQFLSKLYTSGRHLNCSVYQLLQRFHSSRSNRLNAEYIICGSIPADASALATIARQIDPEDGGKHILQCWRQATSKPYGFLVIDLHTPDSRLRLRDTELDTIFAEKK